MNRETKLTNKQAAFIREYLIDRNAYQAALRAGYSAKTALQQGWQVMQHPAVKAGLAAADKQLQERANVSIETIADELNAAYALARDIGQPAAMVSASLGKAKLYGLIVEKREHRLADARTATMAELMGFAAEATAGEGETAGEGLLH